MPFIPHTSDDIAQMLAVIGVPSIDALFDEIPPELRAKPLDGVPTALSEMEIGRLMTERAAMDGRPLNFLGAGAYEHHIPAPVWALATRGEFYSAYTPYQAEASQGTLQLIYEYQSMMCALTGMEVSNASLYDGASALAEACLMAVRSNRSGARRILMPRTVNPTYRKVAQAITRQQGLEFETVDFERRTGRLALDELRAHAGRDFAALAIQQPNFFGNLEEIDAIADWAHANDVLLIAVVNPISLALYKPPAEWGTGAHGKWGADIVCGEGQPLGVPLSMGGPYFGFMATRLHHVRQMPGRIVGRTLDAEGHPGFTLTLQAREQHIRRSKATSNICTNQGLMVTAATIYMSLLGAAGLASVAAASALKTAELTEALARIPGVEPAFEAAHFHEAVLRLDRPAAPVLAALAARGIAGGLDLAPAYPELGHAILVCATETKTQADIEIYARALGACLQTAARDVRGAA
jgi:glycine dehydrogenase subunit 1